MLADSQKKFMDPSSPNPYRAGNRLQEILALKNKTSSKTQSWLIIYLDVITLLLALFIMLVNQPQQEFLVEKPKLPKEKLQTEKILVSTPVLTEDLSNKIANSQHNTPTAEKDIANELRKQIETIQGEKIKVQVERGKINLQLPESILFTTGKSKLLPAANDFLKKIVPILKLHDYPISIEGHTDNIPILSQQYPSNWELSAARASVVVRQLGEQGIAYSRLKAIGYADTKPIASNDTAEGRRSNRRVNLIIEATNK